MQQNKCVATVTAFAFLSSTNLAVCLLMCCVQRLRFSFKQECRNAKEDVHLHQLDSDKVSAAEARFLPCQRCVLDSFKRMGHVPAEGVGSLIPQPEPTKINHPKPDTPVAVMIQKSHNGTLI